jgi:hypothetical protein
VVESQFNNWNAEGIFRVHCGTKKGTLRDRKVVFIRYALVIENYKVNCLNFNVFSQKILILLVSSSKSGKKQIKPPIKQKMYTISKMAVATLYMFTFVVPNPKTKKNKKSPFWKYTFFLKLLSIKVSYNQNNIKYSRVNVQAQTGIIFLKFY